MNKKIVFIFFLIILIFGIYFAIKLREDNIMELEITDVDYNPFLNTTENENLALLVSLQNNLFTKDILVERIGFHINKEYSQQMVYSEKVYVYLNSGDKRKTSIVVRDIDFLENITRFDVSASFSIDKEDCWNKMSSNKTPSCWDSMVFYNLLPIQIVS